jgi:hypothetical protein
VSGIPIRSWAMLDSMCTGLSAGIMPIIDLPIIKIDKTTVAMKPAIMARK